MASPPAAGDLIGHNKEHNFVNNTHDLCIIGHNNRIRFVNNTGNLQITGHEVKLLMENNAGNISFMGNDGRINFKGESPQQLVSSTVHNVTLEIVSPQAFECQQGVTKDKKPLFDDAELSTYVGEIRMEPSFTVKALCYNPPNPNLPPAYTPMPHSTQLYTPNPSDPPPPYSPPQLPKKYDLLFSGSKNRIQLSHNLGEVKIIGDSTRLIIHKNAGSVKYTGDGGRICLGSESTQQAVDYNGLNGLVTIASPQEQNEFLQA